MRQKPLAELTLRKYEKPFRLSGRELVKKLCFSIGLLQPGDSRDVVVDVLYSVVHADVPLLASEIKERVKQIRESNKLSLSGCTPQNIRRQLRRLKDISLVERTGMHYRIKEGASLPEAFSEHIEKLYLPAIVSRIKEYCDAVHKEVENGKDVS